MVKSALKKYQILSDDENSELIDEFGESFQSMIGAEAIQKLLSEIDLEQEQKIVREELYNLVRDKEKKTSKKIKVN